MFVRKRWKKLSNVPSSLGKNCCAGWHHWTCRLKWLCYHEIPQRSQSGGILPIWKRRCCFRCNWDRWGGGRSEAEQSFWPLCSLCSVLWWPRCSSRRLCLRFADPNSGEPSLWYPAVPTDPADVMSSPRSSPQPEIVDVKLPLEKDLKRMRLPPIRRKTRSWRWQSRRWHLRRRRAPPTACWCCSCSLSWCERWDCPRCTTLHCPPRRHCSRCTADSQWTDWNDAGPWSDGKKKKHELGTGKGRTSVEWMLIKYLHVQALCSFPAFILPDLNGPTRYGPLFVAVHSSQNRTWSPELHSKPHCCSSFHYDSVTNAFNTMVNFSVNVNVSWSLGLFSRLPHAFHKPFISNNCGTITRLSSFDFSSYFHWTCPTVGQGA